MNSDLMGLGLASPVSWEPVSELGSEEKLQQTNMRDSYNSYACSWGDSEA
jgi:hypothetical protein